MALYVTDRFIFTSHTVSDDEYEVFMNKAILTQNDILKFCKYYYQDNDLEYDDYDAVFKRITRQDDCYLWEMLNQNMINEDDFPDYASCLRYALKYASYQVFGHVLYHFCTIDNQYDISYDDLKQLSARNPDRHVRLFVNQLDFFLSQKQEFSSKCAFTNKKAIFNSYKDVLRY